MEKNETNPTRNRPADERKNNDSYTRDRSGQQPGVSTYSSSDTDEASNKITETAADSFREEDFGKKADTTFDEVLDDDDK